MMTPNAIGAALVELDAQGAQIDAGFSNCPDASPTTRAQWNAYYAAYRNWSTKAHKFVGSSFRLVSAPYLAAADLSALGDQTAGYQTSMNGWSDTVNATCGGNASKNNPSPPGLKAPTDLLTAASWLIGIGLVGYLAVTYLPRPRR